MYDERRVFPRREQDVVPVRTNVAFDEMRDEEHHKGENPLRRLSLGMISQFGLDYMHLICLGVMKRLLVQCWLKGPLHCRIGCGMKNQISGALTSLRSCIPREFARKPRSLDDVYMWKAIEFRLFLLYTGPVTTRNEATPGNEAKKTLPENVANFVGGYIFWEPHTQK